MASSKDNVITNSEVTAPGQKLGSIETVFIHTTFDNATGSQMNVPTMSRETKSGGQDVISTLNYPI